MENRQYTKEVPTEPGLYYYLQVPPLRDIKFLGLDMSYVIDVSMYNNSLYARSLLRSDSPLAPISCMVVDMMPGVWAGPLVQAVPARKRCVHCDNLIKFPDIGLTPM